MTSCDCPDDLPGGATPKMVERKTRSYREGRLEPTTTMLIEAIVRRGVTGLTVLDVGGGVGAVHHELLRSGAARAVDVDGTAAYQAAARAEAVRHGHADRVDYRLGDVVQLADRLAPVDVVTLDRVVCCYEDFEALLGVAAEHARQLVGMVYPRDTWWKRACFFRFLHAYEDLIDGKSVWFLHPSREMDAVLRRHGFEPDFDDTKGIWRVQLYERRAA
jgi:SAM-dependent methyltransferase